jgi:peptidoglycan hydrolase CwlO-like protein
MRREMCLALVMVLVPFAAHTQTASKPATASELEQIQREMLKEIRLLRAELLRMSVNTNRAQMLLARVRAQQEQVIHITREISDVREKLDGTREQEQKKRAELSVVEGKIKVELLPETAAVAVRNDISSLQNREQSLMERETRLTGELNDAYSMLSTLDSRLDEIDREMANTAERAGTTKAGAREH